MLLFEMVDYLTVAKDLLLDLQRLMTREKIQPPVGAARIFSSPGRPDGEGYCWERSDDTAEGERSRWAGHGRCGILQRDPPG